MEKVREAKRGGNRLRLIFFCSYAYPNKTSVQARNPKISCTKQMPKREMRNCQYKTNSKQRNAKVSRFRFVLSLRIGLVRFFSYT